MNVINDCEKGLKDIDNLLKTEVCQNGFKSLTDENARPTVVAVIPARSGSKLTSQEY